MNEILGSIAIIDWRAHSYNSRKLNDGEIMKTKFDNFEYGITFLHQTTSILIYISLWIDCLFEIRKIAVCFLWLSLPGDYRVTDEALLAKTT